MAVKKSNVKTKGTKAVPKKAVPKNAAKAAPKPVPKQAVSIFVAEEPPIETSTVNIERLLSQLPVLTQPVRLAYTAQRDVASCVALGARTKSGAVRECAVQWAASAAGSLRGTSKELIAYTPERLAYLVELITQLDRARTGSAVKGESSVVLRTTRDLARARVRRTSTRLGRMLDRATRGDATMTTSLARLRERGASDRDTAELVLALAGLVRELCQGTAAQRAVAASFGLSLRVASDAETTARSLLDAREEVALGAEGAVQRDSMPVNAIEGRILLEMRDLKAAIDDAREDGAMVPPMVPTAGVLAAFPRRGPSEPEETPAT